MKRLLGTLIGLAVMVLVLFIPAAIYGDTSEEGPADSDETTITSYVADFVLDEQGDLTTTETLTVDFPFPGKHGIFRFWDTEDQTAPDTVRRIPRDIEVTMDGGDVPVDMSTQAGGQYKVARIGDADSTVKPGEHVYEISYRIDGVLEPGTDGTRTQFYWNLIPEGWAQRIDSADLTVHLPAVAEQVQCAVGDDEAGCQLEGDGTQELHIRVGSLDPRTPVTLKTGLDLATPPPGDERPWAPALDAVLGPNLILLLGVLVAAVGAGLLGLVLARRAAERDPQFPVMYAPPEGIGPAQAAYLVTEEVDDEQYVATLMYAAERGAIDLDRADDAWTIADKNGAEGWAGLDPVTSGVAHLLGGPGTSFVASPKDVAAGKRLKTEIESFEENTRTWASTAGLMTKSGLGGSGMLVIGLCAAAVVAIAIFNPFRMSAIGLVPGAFAVFGAYLAAPSARTRRTKTGRDLWSRAGGFRRILSTPSAQERFDFSGRQDLYTAYVPWAVAFGCAEEWAGKYRTEMGAEPPVPSYFGPAYAGAYTGSVVSSMVDDFNTTVSSAISSYEATQKSSSSSGGGGGFSGGGGGGGGGGGSW